MRTLPRELEPWEPYLGFLDPTLAPALGRLADGVLRALKGIGAQRPHTGEPSGWSGLDRRGPMERLLCTDWALADVAPDEFMRRTTQGELLFWQRERAASPLGGTSRLLLDAGPFQVGACRVVQLALLIVLARRAAEVGIQFAWCLGQESHREHAGLSRGAVQSFLKGRSTRPVSDLDVERFAQRAGPDDELWLCGSARFLARHPKGFLNVELEPSGFEAVYLKLRGRQETLPLPPPECVRLLRDPFGAEQARVHAHAQAAQGDLAFSRCGRKLLVRSPGEVVVYPVPNSPRDQVGLPHRYPVDPGRVVVAVGYADREVLSMEAGGNAWTFRKAQRQFVPNAPELSFPMETRPLGPLGRLWLEEPDRTALREHFESPAELQRWRMTLALENKRFVCTEQPQNILDDLCLFAPRFWMVLEGTLWMSHPAHGLVRVAELGGSHAEIVAIGSRLYRAQKGRLAMLADLTTQWGFPGPGDRTLLGWGGRHGLSRAPECVAVVCLDSTNTVLWSGRPFSVGGWPMGVCSDPDHWKTPAVVIGDAAVVRFQGNAWEQVVDLTGEVRQVVLSPNSARFAYRLADGELGIYSLPHRRHVLRVRP